MAIFDSKRKMVLGLDIGTASVKVLELSMGGLGYQIESYAVEPLPPNAVQEGNISAVGEVGEAIKRAYARSKSRIRRAAVAVAGSAIIAKTIAMEANLSDADIQARITAEASRYIPHPLKEVAMDFEVQGLSEQDPGQVDVLLVACRRNHIEQLSAALAASGVKLAVIEPESQAIERVYGLLQRQFERQAGEFVVAVVDVGAAVATVTVLVDGRCVFAREQSFGGQCLTEDAAQHVSRALRLFFSSTHYSDVDQMLLVGGAAATEGLADALQSALGVSAVIADPFAGMALAPRIDTAALAEDAPALALACGLALRSFD